MISINQARKTLGKKTDNMTNQQVQTVINSLKRLAEIVVDQTVNIIKKKKKELKDYVR